MFEITDCNVQTLPGVSEDPVCGQLQQGEMHVCSERVLQEDPPPAQPQHRLLSLQVRAVLPLTPDPEEHITYL